MKTLSCDDHPGTACNALSEVILWEKGHQLGEDTLTLIHS